MQTNQMLLSRYPIIFITVSALLLMSLSTNATSRWSVEILIFQNKDLIGSDNEHWPKSPGKPDLSQTIEFTHDSIDPHDIGTHKLDIFATRLQSSDLYRPLLLLGWSQDEYSKKYPRRIHVHSGIPNRFKTQVDAVDGWVSLTKARYLHLEVDLILYGELISKEIVDAEHFRLRDKRRIKHSRQVHYIDHPMFGILVYITPEEKENDEVFVNEENITVN